MQRWSEDDIRKIVAAHDQGTSWRELAEEHGYGDDVRTFSRAIRKRRERLHIQQSTSDRIKAHREQVHRKAELEALRGLTAKRAMLEELAEVLTGAVETLPVPAAFVVNPNPPKDLVGLSLLSDVHVGMSVPGRLNAGWTQNTEITEEQFTSLAQQIISYEPRPKTLRILDLGDDVEGSSMRVSQIAIVDRFVAQQAILYGQMLAEFITTLLPYFEHIQIDRVPGNHGRVSSKAGLAGLDELDPANSWDWVGGEMARAMLKPAIDAKRVTLINHESFYGTTDILGHKILFEHGSSLRGGSSWGGIPWYGVERMAAAYRDLEGDYSLLAVGHWHRPFHASAGRYGHVLANGSFPPTTPFVVASKHQAARSCQLYCQFGTEGLVSVQHLYLDTYRDR